MTFFRTAQYVHFWWLLVNPKIPYNIERENKIKLGTEEIPSFFRYVKEGEVVYNDIYKRRC